MRDAILIDGLRYSYRSDWARKEKTVLHDVSLSVQEGECFGFIGHNGAGKTTTMKCILNLCHPKKGHIGIFGVPSSKVESRDSVGYLPEQPYFYDNITTLETLSLMADLYGIQRQEKKDVITWATELLSLDTIINRPMRNLSKGQMQCVGLAQALLAKPKLLMLDEPFSGLDPIGRKNFRDIFLELKKQGVTLFISSHVLSDVEILCDRVSILVHGTLKGVFSLSDLPATQNQSFLISVAKGRDTVKKIQTESGSLQGIVLQEHTNSVTCTITSDESAQRLLGKLIEAGEKILSYESQGRDLESLFVSLVKEEH